MPDTRGLGAGSVSSAFEYERLSTKIVKGKGQAGDVTQNYTYQTCIMECAMFRIAWGYHSGLLGIHDENGGPSILYLATFHQAFSEIDQMSIT